MVIRMIIYAIELFALTWMIKKLIDLRRYVKDVVASRGVVG